MRQSIILKLTLAAGLALLLTAALLGVILAAPAAPEAAITLQCNPSPPYSISRGMTETIVWEINPFTGTPNRVEFKLEDPDGVVIDSATYPGNAGLSVTRFYTVPSNPKEGFYWAKIQYWSEDAGQEAAAEVKFYVAERGNLHVFKFNDVNGNRKQDPGELGVPDVRIRLLTPFGDQVSKLTDSTGWALWDKVAIGTYKITETLTAGWVPVLPPTATTTVRIDATTVITFANQQTGNLRVFKFEDANGNQLQDAGEGPVQGVTITVQSPAGTLSTKTTDLNGLAVWNAIPAGTYRVTETLPAGWQATLPLPPLPPAATATVPFNGTANVTFANRRIGNLRIFKFEDANGNQLQDAGEGPVQGVTITVQSPAGTLSTKTTDLNGLAVWNAIPVGAYRVTETLPAGWQATLPLPPLPPAATATVPFNGTANVTFANRRIGNLRIFKFEDANGNLLQDAGEGPVQGVTITVQAPAGTLSTKTTDLNGLAVWNAIPVGAYRVTETLPAGWQATLPLPPLPPAATATVPFNGTANVTFANRRIGNLRIFKFEDANGNLLQDAGEGPVQGVTITVQSPAGTLSTKTTDLNGLAVWNAIPVGAYRVTETLPAGWQATLPPCRPPPRPPCPSTAPPT